MGYNLPPGVEVYMIPGNRPEDILWEQAWEEVDETLVLDVCRNNRDTCGHAIFDDEGEFEHCDFAIVTTATIDGEEMVLDIDDRCPPLEDEVASIVNDKEKGMYNG